MTMIARWSYLSWLIHWTEYIRERFYRAMYVHNCKSSMDMTLLNNYFFTCTFVHCAGLSSKRQLWRKLIERSTWQQLTHYGSDTEHIMLRVKGGRYMFRFWHRNIHSTCLYYPVLWSEMFECWISGILMNMPPITPLSIWVQDNTSDNSHSFFVNKFSPGVYSTNILPAQELEDYLWKNLASYVCIIAVNGGYDRCLKSSVAFFNWWVRPMWAIVVTI